MEIDAQMLKKLAELKKQLESISGKKIDINEEQLIKLFFPVASFSGQDGKITITSVILPSKSCYSAGLLDVSGYSYTGADGKRVFLLSEFICTDTTPLYLDPANVIVTPNAMSPCYATMSRRLMPNPNAPGVFSDVEITVFTWAPNGKPAPNIGFDWRCRVPQVTLL